jgi:hypothetical protein
MNGDKEEGGLPYGLGAVLANYGLGGLVLVLGIVLMGLSIYKGSSFAAETTQLIVVIGGSLVSFAVIALGVVLLRRGKTDSSRAPRHDVFIAAPMAGFGTDEAGRKAAVDIVNRTQAALQRIGLQQVYTPVLARPEPPKYETPSTGFDVEWDALRSSKRYLLILPAIMPAGTSVLVTAGVAVALGVPTVVFARKDAPLPYLIQGAVESKRVNVRLREYLDIDGIEQTITNDGLRLFGE